MAKQIDKAALERFLQKNERELARIVARVTGDMRSTITYEQVRDALLTGVIDEGWVAKWREAYSEFVTEELAQWWRVAMFAAVKPYERMHAGRFVFDDHTHAVAGWVQERAAALVTDISDGQRRALRAVIQRALGTDGMGVDELAVVIRPLIGLTTEQAEANYRYFKRVRDTLTRMHPRTSAERINERARRAAARYAERQHRSRAASIARTELSRRTTRDGILRSGSRWRMGCCLACGCSGSLRTTIACARNAKSSTA